MNSTGMPTTRLVTCPRTSRTDTVPVGSWGSVGRGMPDIARASGMPAVPPVPPICARAGVAQRAASQDAMTSARAAERPEDERRTACRRPAAGGLPGRSSRSISSR